MPFDQWRDQELGKRGLSEHLFEHFLTMARLHAANRYDRLTHDVEAITGRPATSIRDFVAQHKALFDKHSIRQGSNALAASSPGTEQNNRGGRDKPGHDPERGRVLEPDRNPV